MLRHSHTMTSAILQVRSWLNGCDHLLTCHSGARHLGPDETATLWQLLVEVQSRLMHCFYMLLHHQTRVQLSTSNGCSPVAWLFCFCCFHTLHFTLPHLALIHNLHYITPHYNTLHYITLQNKGVAIFPLLDQRANTSLFPAACSQEELKAQACAVWQFITDRQVEAPDEFASLQTHRVQLAVARRQLAFVEQLEQVAGHQICWSCLLAGITQHHAVSIAHSTIYTTSC